MVQRWTEQLQRESAARWGVLFRFFFFFFLRGLLVFKRARRRLFFCFRFFVALFWFCVKGVVYSKVGVVVFVLVLRVYLCFLVGLLLICFISIFFVDLFGFLMECSMIFHDVPCFSLVFPLNFCFLNLSLGG